MKPAFHFEVQRSEWDSGAARSVARELEKRANELDAAEARKIQPHEIRVGATFYAGGSGQKRRIARPDNAWLAFDDEMRVRARCEPGTSSDTAATYFEDKCGYTKEPNP